MNTTQKVPVTILTGFLGSGKTTLAKSIQDLSHGREKWARVSQDILRSRDKCIKAARKAILQGKHVIVDRTNLTQSQRKPWINLAAEFGIRPEAVVMKTPHKDCVSRACQRQDGTWEIV